MIPDNQQQVWVINIRDENMLCWSNDKAVECEEGEYKAEKECL